MTLHDLHAIATRFNHQRVTEDLSERQEWLYDAVISELMYRRRQTRPMWKACACFLCLEAVDLD
jgi:hypothetical protein